MKLFDGGGENAQWPTKTKICVVLFLCVCAWVCVRACVSILESSLCGGGGRAVSVFFRLHE